MSNSASVFIWPHETITQGWSFIINFDLMQEIEPKVGDRCSFMDG